MNTMFFDRLMDGDHVIFSVNIIKGAKSMEIGFMRSVEIDGFEYWNFHPDYGFADLINESCVLREFSRLTDIKEIQP